MHHAARCFGLVLFAVSSLTAQQIQGKAWPGVHYASGSSTPSQAAETATPAQDAQMPVFLSGRVVMGDGTAPDTSIAIQRVCGGSPITVAWTDGKGQFSFQWGRSTSIIQDASETTRGSSGDIGGNSLRGCELMANAPGFRSLRLDLSTHRAGDNPNLGMIILHRMAEVEGTSVSVTALNAPKDAKKAWEKGVAYLRKSRAADAEKELEKAVGIYPKYANAWLDLGRARIQRRAEGPAREAFLNAISADGKLVEPYVELGELAARDKIWPDAALYLDRALQLDPVDFPRLWFEDAVADYHVQQFDRAERNAREALKLPAAIRDPRADTILGLILSARLR
jgi:Flp pilus assembly protein TadD